MERESELTRQSVELAVQAVGFYTWLVDEKNKEMTIAIRYR